MSFLLICFAPHIFRTPRIIVDRSVNTNLNLEEISRQTLALYTSALCIPMRIHLKHFLLKHYVYALFLGF